MSGPFCFCHSNENQTTASALAAMRLGHRQCGARCRKTGPQVSRGSVVNSTSKCEANLKQPETVHSRLCAQPFVRREDDPTQAKTNQSAANVSKRLGQFAFPRKDFQ
jgi:hypothetical protein